MRIYLPATAATLREVVQRGEIGPPPLTAFAVTPALRDWYLDDDAEALEYAALSEAARGSLRLLDADPSQPSRRVVVAADVADTAVDVRDDLDRGVVHVRVVVPLAAVAAIHADDPDAAAAVARAAEAVLAADLGGSAAQEAVDDAEGFELSWYARQELEHLLSTM